MTKNRDHPDSKPEEQEVYENEASDSCHSEQDILSKAEPAEELVAGQETSSATSLDADSVDQFHKLNEEIAEINNKYLLAQADIMNLKKKHLDELKKEREYSISRFAIDLLAVKDALEMAVNDQSNNIDNMKMGVELTLKELVRVFEHNKIKEIATAVGDKLDPSLHQALSLEESVDAEANTILGVMQKGYKLNDRVIRATSVKVSK